MGAVFTMRSIDTRCCGRYNEQNSDTFLQELTVHFYWIIMEPTQRSVKYFSLLIGGSIDFQWAEGRYNMWYVLFI